MAEKTLHLYEFGPYRLDANQRLLFRDEEVVPLTPKVIDTLLVLITKRGEVVEKSELMDALWPDSFVEESSLTQNISLLRKALGKEAGEFQYIETIPKRGYRFTAEVREVCDGPQVISQPKEEPAPVPAEERASPPVKQQKNVRFYLLLALPLLLLLGSIILYLRPGSAAKITHTPKTIAVLPFKTLNVEPGADLTGLGMADAIILKLSELREPTVLPTSSILRYVDDNSDALAVGRKLGVEAVLEGMIQRSGNQIRITTRLIRIRDGAILWADKFDEPAGNVFVLQDVISARLAQSLVPQLTEGTRERMAKRQMQNPEAYQAYTNGIYFWNKRNREAITKAISYFQEAIRKEPSYALAYAMLADCYLLSIHYQYRIVPADEARKLRNEAGRKALELDPNLAEAHLATVEFWLESNNLEAAERSYQKAISLNPNHAIARTRYANLLLHTLRLEQGLMQARKGLELDPVSPTTNSVVCSLSYFSRSFDDVLRYCGKAVELEPHAPPPIYNLLGCAYMEKGMYDEAIAQFRLMGELRPVDASMAIAQVHAKSGRRAEANKILPEVLKSKDQPQFNSYRLARLYLALGDKEKSLEWLERGLDKVKVAWLEYDPELDALRDEPEFRELVRRKALGKRELIQ